MRTRILAAMLAVAAVGLAVAGGAAYLVQREQVIAGVDRALDDEVGVVRTVAESVPAGEASVSAVLTALMQRIAPRDSESTLAVLDGAPFLVPPQQLAFRIDDDPALLARALAEADATRVVRGTDVGPLGTLRYMVVPVAVEGDPAVGRYIAAVDLDAELGRLAEAFRAYAIIALVSLLALGIVGWLVAGRLLRPLRRLQTAAAHANEHDLSERVAVTGRDDVSDLARTMNGMLDRLEGAFASQRRLLDDVGHELRTPITIVRGHLELLDADDPDEVRGVRDLSVDELDRMSLLVDDLTLLATADSPGFVDPRPLDIAQLTTDVLAKAAALSTDHRWMPGPAAGVVILADRRRVTEAWLQFAENAAKYSPPGSEIRIGSTAVGATVELWVDDEGGGIDPEQRSELFARFARGTTRRGVEGSGLGLAIVAAIAAAHHGTARLDPLSAGGTRAVLALPIDPPQEDPWRAS